MTRGESSTGPFNGRQIWKAVDMSVNHLWELAGSGMECCMKSLLSTVNASILARGGSSTGSFSGRHICNGQVAGLSLNVSPFTSQQL